MGYLNNYVQGSNATAIAPLPLTIQGKKFTWNQQYITGTELKKLGGIPLEKDLFLSLVDPWDDELVLNEGQVNLARPGIEQFYTRQPLEFRLEHTKHTWDKPFISGAELRKLGSVEAGDEIWLSVARPYTDELIDDNKKVDLARPEVEKFYVRKLKVVIRINNVEYTINRGDYTVSQLKAIGGVKASDEMDALKGHQLTPLDDAALIHISGSEQFISHVRDGSSS